MANVNDIMRILDIDTALFNKADNKIIFVGEQLFAKFQFAVRNSVFKSELNLIIVTFIIATLLFVLDPLGKKSRKEKITSPPVEIDAAKSEKIAYIAKKEASLKSEKKEEDAVIINGKKSSKVTKVNYDPLDSNAFDAFVAELRNPGFHVTRIKKDAPDSKKILRLNDEGMLYWSKDKVLGISKHTPWAPEYFKGSSQDKSKGTFTIKFRSAASGDAVAKEYELKVEAPLTPDQIIKGLSDLAEKRTKDKTVGKKVPSTPSSGKFSGIGPENETTAASITPTVSPVKEEPSAPLDSPSTPTK